MRLGVPATRGGPADHRQVERTDDHGGDDILDANAKRIPDPEKLGAALKDIAGVVETASSSASAKS